MTEIMRPRAVPVLALAALLGCDMGPSATVEWTLAVDPEWAGTERWEDIRDAQLAAVRARMDHLNDLALPWGLGARVDSVALASEGRIVVSVAGPGAESVDLTPFLVRGSSAELRFVRDDVDLQRVEPGVAELLDEYVARSSVPGLEISLRAAGAPEYPIPADRVEALDSVRAAHHWDRRLGTLDLVWGESVSVGDKDIVNLYLVERDPFITPADIESVVQGDEDGVPSFYIELSEAAGARVHRATSRRVGNRVAVLWRGRLIYRPLALDAPVGQYFTLPASDLDEATALDLRMSLLTGPLPAPMAVVDVRTRSP